MPYELARHLRGGRSSAPRCRSGARLTPASCPRLPPWPSSGFSVGAGLETALSNKMTVGIEYRYSQFEKEDFSDALPIPSGLAMATPSFHTVRIDAKYKFN
ncbi:outer membrane beta-barrel protein [Mesorhizobium sp. CA18]|nr:MULTISPECIES: outer membrane beta-barrel protein [unclassified Mesorhizobium]MBZ9734855.1 outer membrane beta-barrel protein [Mesorhizobium sp. CA9]MBZ9827154.1 outer membrane beta-barrel protein [Mesorhizobium sp. CA18]MBZ9832598.1 outer membrane beta-barrel protein [Mesorhizobium sp. CA2]MBZ9838656.1 outer membrane beta-barrel protein [Mesorhizobium sp. CA3]MBZ9879264.1 outer membrane beta-barrel protein [Mesorhizobium sp. Ca11]